jgi:hypothetical protein
MTTEPRDRYNSQVGSVVPVCLESARRRAAKGRFVNSFSVRSPLDRLCANDRMALKIHRFFVQTLAKRLRTTSESLAKAAARA